MSLDLALWTLLHLLVLVYWLGGDLGAFYTSRFLVQPGISSERRLLSAAIVTDVDMAPRTALILAFPTGYMLAQKSGWMTVPLWTVWCSIVASLVWLGLAWSVHLRHDAGMIWLRRADLLIRWILSIGLIVVGIGSFVGQVRLPDFIALKFVLLAMAIFMGLMIRKVLAPLGPALAGLSGSDPEAAEAQVARTLGRARPLVLVIWCLILIASLTGLLKPQFT